MKIIFALASIFILALHVDSRSVENELVRTPHMDRRFLTSLNGRIVNGFPADIADFPYMVALLDLSRGGFRCGASIIHRLWSVSAAHCLEGNTPPSQINLRGGSTNRLTGGHIFYAQSYTLHPDYNRVTLDYDIAIIRVQDDTPMEGHLNVLAIPISPICSSLCCQVCTDVDVTITGWGRNENGVLPVDLVQLTKPIHDHADCSRIWGGVGDSFFCKQVFDGRDSCNGDSGSPLVATHGGVRYQVGLVSFGSRDCGDGSAPSVNVRIEQTNVRNWINTMSGV